MPKFYGIFARKYLFPCFWGYSRAGSKAESEQIQTNTNYVIMAGIVLRAQSC